MPLIGTRGAASAQGFGEFAQQASVVQAEAIDYDGTNDWLTNSSGLTGNTAGKTFTFSTFVYVPTNTSNRYLMMFGSYANNAGFHVFLNSSNRLYIRGYSGSSAVLDMYVNTPDGALSTFMSIVVSIDLANTSNRYVYLNDINVTANVIWNTYSNVNIDFNTTPQWIAHTGSPYAPYKGRLSNVFFDKTYRDLSITANRRLFVTADLKPAAGQAALNPLVYVPMSDPTQPGLNQGTGGNFTLTGVVARSGRGPNQYNTAALTTNGTSEYLTKSVTGITNSTVLTFFAAIKDTTGSYTFSIERGTYAPLLITSYDNYINVYSRDSTNSDVVFVTFTHNLPRTGRYLLVVFSIDSTDSSKCVCYVNGVAATRTVNTFLNQTMELASGVAYLGYYARNASYYAITCGSLWFNTSYIDLTVQANREKFVTGTGINAMPVSLGTNGELPTGSSPLIYLPLLATSAGKNNGTCGDFTAIGTFAGARGPSEYWGNKAVFNGTTGNLRRTSALTGIVNGKTWSFSFFVSRGQVSIGGTELVLSMGRTGFNPGQILLNSSGYIQILLHNSSNTTILLGTTSTTQMVNNTTYHVCGCIDLTNTAKRFIFVNGVQQTVSWSVYTNDTIAWASYDLPTLGSNIGSGGSYAAYLQGFLSEFYMTTSYIDFSQEANRLLFIDAFGYPTNLPAAITALTVPEPTIYMRFPPTSFGTNSGAGGNFTVNGTITDGGQL